MSRWPMSLAILGALLVSPARWVAAAPAPAPTAPPTTAPGSAPADFPAPGTPVPRVGDEIVVCGQLFHTGTPVVLWMDPGGYDAYRVERRFGPIAQADWDHAQKAGLPWPARFGLRDDTLTPAQVEQVRGGGWDLPLLQQVVDQFVLHYDQAGTSRQCFRILHDSRGLSVHFLLDLDGTVYQTLDLKERAWHASTANNRSIGVEIAHPGAVSLGVKEIPGKPNTPGMPLDQHPALKCCIPASAQARWYPIDPAGHVRLQLPMPLESAGLRHGYLALAPARDQPVRANIQGIDCEQYDFTPQQYQALVRLTATLCRVFPRLKCDYPRDAQGQLITHIMSKEELGRYQGLLAHYHIQLDKVDPGPAMNWEYVVGEARKMMEGK